jgi:hypothetical protein
VLPAPQRCPLTKGMCLPATPAPPTEGVPSRHHTAPLHTEVIRRYCSRHMSFSHHFIVENRTRCTPRWQNPAVRVFLHNNQNFILLLNHLQYTVNKLHARRSLFHLLTASTDSGSTHPSPPTSRRRVAMPKLLLCSPDTHLAGQ